MGTGDTRVIEGGGRRWHVRPEAAEPLLAAGWPRRTPDRIETIKRGRGRTVQRLDIAGRTYYLKAYQRGGLWRRLRALLGWGPAWREWRSLAAARAAGLDVPDPVAVAPRAPEAILTAGIPAGRRLDEYLFERHFEPAPGEPPYPGARPPELVALFRRRREPPAGTIGPAALAFRLADVIVRLAEADLFLPDLHPGNILIVGPEGLARLYLVDLAEAVSPAPPEALLQHLALLEHFFEPIASAPERLRCHTRAGELLAQRRGLGTRDWGPGNGETALPGPAAVSRACAIYRERFYCRRDRRTHRESKYFRRIRTGPWRGWATADWAEAVSRLLEAGDPARSVQAEPIKTGRTSSVWRIRLPDGRALIVKRHNRAGDRSFGAWRPSRSVAAFRKGHALLARGIGAARPAAAVDRREGGRLAETLLFSEPVEGGAPLSDWLRSGPPAGQRRRAARTLAHLLRRMHDAGFSHRDLKAPNILVVPAAPAAAPALGGPGPGPAGAARAALSPGAAPGAVGRGAPILGAGPGGAGRAAPSPGAGPGAAGRAALSPGAGPGGAGRAAPSPGAAAPGLFLVDLDGLRARRRVSAARCARDLMRLSVSLEEWGVARRTDRLRFLKAYLGGPGRCAPITIASRRRGRTDAAQRLRRWWRRIEGASVPKRQALGRKRPASRRPQAAGGP